MGFLGKLFDKPTTRDEFAKLAAKQMVICGWPEPTYEPANFILRTSPTQFLGLENVYRNYLECPKAERAAFLAQWFKNMRDTAMPETFAEAKGALLPMVRRRSEWLTLLGKVATEKATLVSRSFSDDLRLGLVLDRPTTVAVLNAGQLERWGVDADAPYDAAIHNLRLKSADAWSQAFPGVYVSGWRDTFDATRAIFPDVVRRVPIEGEPVIMMPNRNHLFVASRRDETALQIMVAAAASLYDKQDYSLSMQPLTLEGDAWVPFNPGGAAQNEIRKRVLSHLASAYEKQKEHLLPSEPEVFWAKLLVLQKNESGDITSLASWTDGVPTLLPKADRIGFVKGKDDIADVTWEQAESVVGTLAEEPGPWPPRYRVSSFPSDEHYARLKEIALSGNLASPSSSTHES